MAMIYDLGILCFMHSTFLKFCVKRDYILKTETYNNATKHLFFFSDKISNTTIRQAVSF